MEMLKQDLAYALRVLRRQPGFTAIAALMLVLGIGANTAIFSVVNTVLLQPLPFRQPERVVTVWENNRRDGIPRDDVSPANFLDWRERQKVFEEMATSNPWSLDYTGGGEPETFQNALVSRGFFEILGAGALLGRTFLREEYEPGHNNVVVLSHALWQRRFGRDPGVIGRTLSLDNKPTVVVGVMPPEFRPHLHLPEPEAYQPQAPEVAWRFQRRATYLKVVARLRPAVTVDQAQAAMDTIAAQLASEHPSTNAGVGAIVVPLREHLVGNVRTALLLMFAAVGIVLLIACANVGNLTLARSNEREREIAIRTALGAGRGRIIAQLLTESVILGLTGCVGGLLLASWAVPVLVALAPADVPLLETVRLDGTVLAFAAAAGLLTSLLFGLVPALQTSGTDAQDRLKEGARAGAGRFRRRTRGVLVVAEFALALVLLISAGLLIRSFVNLLRVDPGFSREKVIALQTFVWDRYSTPARRLEFSGEVLRRLEELPGVEAAGVTTALPLFESGMDSAVPVTVENQAAPLPGQEPTAYYTIVNSGYFEVMRVPLLRGRLFNRFDAMEAPRVALINEAMARRFGIQDDPVGRKIAPKMRQRGSNAESVPLEVVGLVGSLRHEALDAAPRPEFFIPQSQSANGSLIFVIRTSGDPAACMPAAKSAIWQVDRTQPIYALATMDDLVAGSLAPRRFGLVLLASFAGLALVLAAAGVYGVISYATGLRTREIGVRIALGAQSGDILRMIVGEGLRLAAAGVCVGTALALAATRLLSSLLFEVQPSDPVTYAAVAGLLAAVGILACYVPARRAMRIPPQEALRYE
jgi:putative ABC transport system permease protein